MKSELELISEAYIDMQEAAKERLVPFSNRSEWAQKVKEKHPEAEFSSEGGNHIARKENKVIGRFMYGKGITNTSGTGIVH